jgi:hypothetical protein
MGKVRVEGFEPPISWSQTMRHTKLDHTRVLQGRKVSNPSQSDLESNSPCLGTCALMMLPEGFEPP